MSESFQSALERVNFGKYIDQIQEELKRAIAEMGPVKKPQNGAIQERLMALVNKQTMEMAKEVGITGNQALIFMLSTSIISTAWVSFALKRETSDLSKSPEDRLATIEMLDALELALGRVIRAASDYADQYTGPAMGPKPGP